METERQEKEENLGDVIDALEVAGMWYHDEDSGSLKSFATLLVANATAAGIMSALKALNLGQYDAHTLKTIQKSMKAITSRSARQRADQYFADRMKEIALAARTA